MLRQSRSGDVSVWRVANLALCLALLSGGNACALAREAPSAAVETAAAPAAAPPQASPKSVARKRIIEAALALSAQKPAQARERLERRLMELGGFVESLGSDGSGAGVSVQLVLRVPEANLAALLGAARQLGRVTSETQQSRDVTREYVDVDARLRNLARTEERLLALLGERTGSLADVITVENELARVRAQSEVLTAQLRALDADVAMAKLSVSIDPLPLAVAAPDDALAPLRALWADGAGVVAASASALLSVFAACVRALLALLPWLPVLALGWLGVRRLRALRRS
jgi:hypothetical protein